MTTDKYDLDLVELSLPNWNEILKGSIEDLDSFLQTRILVTLGETVALGEALYPKSDGKWWKAKAVAVQLPAKGLAIEAGNADDEIRVQRIGEITVPGWSWAGDPGDPIFLDGSTNGALTESRPLAFAQNLGHILSSTSIFITINEPSPIHFGYTAAPDPPTGYQDGIAYFQLATTSTTTTTSTTSTTTTTTTI
jgi:hypothetical protein